MELHQTDIPALPVPHVLGLGAGGKPDFWLRPASGPVLPTHIAFRADGREGVRKFYEAAMAAGAKDNGKPGVREIYHPFYYGAFVLDPDGFNIEAVCHTPE
jgi:catechol 2,3-dioxygenase-like lactoylglutathione lyase family enzyme